MAAQTQAECNVITPDTLKVKRRFIARRDRVWAAWTEPERFCKWFGSHGWKCASVAFDNRVGGERTMNLRDPAGQEVTVSGVYGAFDPPEMLSFTWNVDGPGRDVKNTLVTIEFIDEADGTSLRITHEKLIDPKILDEHREGWLANLELVAGYLSEA